MRRMMLVAAVVVGLVALVPGVASGSVTEGQGICDGEATIKGVTYTPDNDTPDKAIPIPEERGVVVSWSGIAQMDNSSFNGKVSLSVAGIRVELEDWSGSTSAATSEGEYELDDLIEAVDENVPGGWIPGLWRVEAEHVGNNNARCAGFVLVKLEGNPLSSPFGWVTLLGLLVSAAGMAMSMRRKST